MSYNDNVLDAITLVSFLIGVANYRENLTQSDKEELMKKFDQQTRDILERVETAVEEQNAMLREILELIKRS